MTKTLRVSHRTEYRYDRPVSFGPHRLMLRPRDGHDLWVQDASLTLSPPATLDWHFDTFGNSVAEATFAEAADRLVIQSDLVITRYPVEARLEAGAVRAPSWPFAYRDDELVDLAPLMRPHCPDELPVLERWLGSSFPHRPDDALALLRRLSDAIHRSFAYSPRDELGTQNPAATISQARGTCRDFAFLFMEAARHFGFAARFVTGYLHDAAGGVQGGGATHAWAEAYLPGKGWIEFDPTNGIGGGGDLIRVAVTRTPGQASPISGSYSSHGARYLGMDIDVQVSEAEAGMAAGAA